MVELNNERIDEILHKETLKKEEVTTILRGIYTRYMRLFEKYFADVDALTDEAVGEMRSYHEETRSLVKYYYMDIPQDVCTMIREFEHKYSASLLGAGWREYLSDWFEEFSDKNDSEYKTEAAMKEAFRNEALGSFYDAMDYLFRQGFGTGSQTTMDAIKGISGLLFGKDK